MEIFKSKHEKQLEDIIKRLEMNMSNNYKDNAQDNLREFEKVLIQKKEAGLLKDKKICKYEEILKEYQVKMKGYSHKDQKPYWT